VADRRGQRRGLDLRREMHLLLRQVSHDYDRLQYNTVVSGAMKMLNALDDATLADTPADGAVLRESWASCCARCTRPRRTSRTRCGSSSAIAATMGELIDAPWPQVDDAALVQDEIELVLQVAASCAVH
jgi:leucyl-tRNA synthetase